MSNYGSAPKLQDVFQIEEVGQVEEVFLDREVSQPTMTGIIKFAEFSGHWPIF